MEVKGDFKIGNQLMQLAAILGLVWVAWQVIERFTRRTVRKQKACTAKDAQRRTPVKMEVTRILG